MKERAPAFQFYPRQFSGDDDIMAMDLDAVGAHILLMCAAAASLERYRIHSDERAIRTRLRNPSEEDWQRIKVQLIGGAWKISEDGLWWEQHGLGRTFQKQREFSEQQRERANAKWNPNSPKLMPNRCQTDATEVPEGSPEACSSSSSSSSKKNTTSETEVSDTIPVPSPEKQAREPSESGLRLAQLLRRMILQNNPTAKVTDLQEKKWALDADRILRLDGRSEKEIASLIEWSQQDGFWFKNILSMAKLREQFDRLTQAKHGKQQQGAESEHLESEDTKVKAPAWTGLIDSDGGEQKK